MEWWNLLDGDGQKYVRRRIEELHPDFIQAAVKNPLLSGMLWFDHACQQRILIAFMSLMEMSLNARKYIVTILELKLVPSTRDLFPNIASFIFQLDSAPCCTAKLLKEWFCTKSNGLLSWPRNVSWPQFYRKLVQMRHPTNKRELIEAVIVSWHVVTKEQLKTH